MYYPWGKLETTLSLSHNESSHGLLLFFPFFSLVFCQNMLPRLLWIQLRFSNWLQFRQKGFYYSSKLPILAGGSRPCAQGQSVGSEERAWRKFPSRRAEEPRAWKWLAFVCFLKWSHMISLSEIWHLTEAPAFSLFPSFPTRFLFL